MAQEKYIHGFHTMYEKEAEDGVFYLNDHLEADFAKVFFVYAQHYAAAPLEDRQGRKYLLTYENEMFILEHK